MSVTRRAPGVVCIWVVAAAAVAVAGCAGPWAGQSKTPAASARDHVELQDPATAGLARQARRDVEQLMELGLAERPRPAPPAIDWILPAMGPSTPGPAARKPARATKNGHGQGRLALTAQEHAGAKTPPVSNAVVAIDRPPGAVGADTERVRQRIVQLSRELYHKAAYSDEPLRDLLLIAATSMLDPDRALAPEAIGVLTQREREILECMQAFFSDIGSQLQATGDPEVVVAAADALGSSLASHPQLSVATVALCSRVEGFGDYDEFSKNDAGRYSFLAHSGQQVVVYVEVDDYQSERNDKEQWVTELSQQLVIYSDRDGIAVWREDWQVGVDASKNRRKDFFIVQLITLPRQLSVGRYQLKILLRDRKSGAEAETAVELEMIADPRMVGR